MSQWARRQCTLVTFLCLPVVGAALSAQLRELPAAALAELHPMQMGMAFLRAGESVGMVLATDADASVPPFPAGSRAAAGARAADQLAIISAAHARYRVYRSGRGLVHIAPKVPTACGQHLALHVQSVEFEGEPLHALALLAEQYNPEVVTTTPPAVMGSASDELVEPYRQRMTYAFAGGTLEAALDHLALAAPGIGWRLYEVRFRPEEGGGAACVVSLFTELTAAWSWTLLPLAP